jgi:hypothetical protein
MVLEAREHDPQDQGCIGRIARQLGVGDQSLRNWVNQAETDRGKRSGLTTEERERLKALEKESRELKVQRNIEASIGFLCVYVTLGGALWVGSFFCCLASVMAVPRCAAHRACAGLTGVTC